jgi:hypothetical protein
MPDIPTEVVLMISTHLDDHNLRALALASRSFCRLLLPEYLCRRGLVVKDAASDSGSQVEVHGLSGYVSLGLLSPLHGFQPPRDMHCFIPYATLEAQSAFDCLTRFLLDPSNTRNLRVFLLCVHSPSSAQLVSKFIKIRGLFCTLPLTHLYLAGLGSEGYYPPNSALRRGVSGGSHTLTTFRIWSDYAFAPGLVQTTMRILNYSPIEQLSISAVSLQARHWSILLGELDMAFLKNIVLEGDIPRPPLIRFLAKHKGVTHVRIRCDVPSAQPRPTRTHTLPFLPDLFSLCAPLAICCDIAERNSNSSNLYDLQVGMCRFDPHDPAFRRLLQILAIGDFQQLRHLELEFGPSSPSTTSQANVNEHDWYGYPARDLKQIRTLQFSQRWSQLSGDIVCPHHLCSHLLCLTQVTGHDVRLCAIISDGRGCTRERCGG